MKHFDYSDMDNLVHDRELIQILYHDVGYEELKDRLLADDFLVLDPSVKVPFFAQVRDYMGARERRDPQSQWIVKPVHDTGILQTGMASVCYFLDFFTHTVSAPAVLVRIGGVFYRASRIIMKAEQLSGAQYTEIPRLKEQLLLDLINRWIYCDEDRNPNNYMVRYNSRNNQIVIAIDFSNVDLLYEGIKIQGRSNRFGWERMEKTRYLTPLKLEHFLIYDMSFYNLRFDGFRKINRKMLLDLCRRCLRHDADRESLARRITGNLLQRIEYVYNYFTGQFPLNAAVQENEKHKDMGQVFGDIYDKYK
jgi:hypothetical protein